MLYFASIIQESELAVDDDICAMDLFPSPAMKDTSLSIDLAIGPCFSDAECFIFWFGCGMGVAATASLAFLLGFFFCAVEGGGSCC